MDSEVLGDRKTGSLEIPQDYVGLSWHASKPDHATALPPPPTPKQLCEITQHPDSESEVKQRTCLTSSAIWGGGVSAFAKASSS